MRKYFFFSLYFSVRLIFLDFALLVSLFLFFLFFSFSM